MTLEITISLVILDHDGMESVVNFPLASDMLLVTAVSITVKSSILSIDIRKENIFSCMNWPPGVALHTVTFYFKIFSLKKLVKSNGCKTVNCHS